MIRKAYITTLVSGGMLLASLGMASLLQHVGWRGMVTQGHWFRAEIEDGNIRIVHARRVDRSYSRKRVAQPLGMFGRAGLWTGSSINGDSTWRYVHVVVPLWAPVAILFAHPAFAFVYGPRRHRKRLWRNQCANCGYDRTGNTSGVCPECGGKLQCDVCGSRLTGLAQHGCPNCEAAAVESHSLGTPGK